MLNRNPLAPNVSESPTKQNDYEITVSPSSPLSPAPPDALAGVFPAWDLLPPDAFIKRVTRKKSSETPTL